jgi:hypothetical protein
VSDCFDNVFREFVPQQCCSQYILNQAEPMVVNLQRHVGNLHRVHPAPGHIIQYNLLLPSISQFSHGSTSLDHLPEACITKTEQPAAFTFLAKFIQSVTDTESPSGYIKAE